MDKKQNENDILMDKRREVTHDESVLNPQQIHESDLSRRERRLIEKEKIKGMGIGRKLEYLWMYYKGVLFGAIGILFLIYFGVDWYHHAKMETVLTVSVVNAGELDADKVKADMQELFEFDDKNSQVNISTNLSTDQSGENFDYYAQMAYMAQLQSSGIDVLIFPESLYDSANIDGIFMDMKEVLDKDTYEALGDRVKGDYITLPDGYLGENMGIYYQPVCAAVIFNAKNVENAGKWLSFLADMK